MESEERPAKIRKVDHVVDDERTAPEAASHEHGQSEQSQVVPTDETKEPDVDQNEDAAAPTMSKNALKKQKRLERWEAGRDDRKAKRKEKIKAKKERRREEWKQIRAEGGAGDADGERVTRTRLRSQPSAWAGSQVPITVIFDCDFEELMFDNELKSLGLQITRCYSDNRKAKYRAHLALSSFGGKMKERFDGILAKQYTSWKGFQFFSEDMVAVAEKSKEWMRGSEGGEPAGALAEGPTGEDEQGEIVYLSSESDNVLERLTPNSTYIIGGLVDKNRHKGLCYKRAIERGIKTAKLPIGEFLHMKSRQVLVTNHVLEIMLKWMEFGDWGKAFMEVLPKRKGGVLKSEADDQRTPTEKVDDEDDEAIEDKGGEEEGGEEDAVTDEASKNGSEAAAASVS